MKGLPPIATAENVERVVPLLDVSRLERSLRFYVEGLGFEVTNRWQPEGRLRWCLLRLGGSALMLQQHWQDDGPAEIRAAGRGVALVFLCKDALALHRELRARGVHTEEPFVGNGHWVTPVKDPDGYRIEFESPTDAPEDTRLSEWRG